MANKFLKPGAIAHRSKCSAYANGPADHWRLDAKGIMGDARGTARPIRLVHIDREGIMWWHDLVGRRGFWKSIPGTPLLAEANEIPREILARAEELRANDELAFAVVAEAQRASLDRWLHEQIAALS